MKSRKVLILPEIITQKAISTNDTGTDRFDQSPCDCMMTYQLKRN